MPPLTKAHFDELIAQLNAATTTIAERIESLLERQHAGGLTPAEEKQVAAALGAEIDKLKAMGADAADPIPEPGGPVDPTEPGETPSVPGEEAPVEPGEDEPVDPVGPGSEG